MGYDMELGLDSHKSGPAEPALPIVGDRVTTWGLDSRQFEILNVALYLITYRNFVA